MGPSVLLRARELASLLSQQLLRECGHLRSLVVTVKEDMLVLEQTQDEQEIIARVAALDIDPQRSPSIFELVLTSTGLNSNPWVESVPGRL